MLAWADKIAGLRKRALTAFGEPVTYSTADGTVQFQVNAMPASPDDPGYAEDDSPLSLSLKFDRADFVDFPYGFRRGDIVKTPDGSDYILQTFLIDRRGLVVVNLRKDSVE